VYYFTGIKHVVYVLSQFQKCQQSTESSNAIQCGCWTTSHGNHLHASVHRLRKHCKQNTTGHLKITLHTTYNV
jgi:hypothetical protein